MSEIKDFSYKKIFHKNFEILTFDVLESTNKTAKELALKDTKEGTTILAFSQTKGRGREDRRFFSPDKSGIYFSIILRPNLSPEKSVLITSAAAVAVSRAIEKLTPSKADIKWVNDVFVGGKKVAGILTESVFSGSGNKNFYSVLGIGINLTVPKGDFPKEIQNIAGAILDSDAKDLRLPMVKAVIDEFFAIYENLETSNYLEEYKKRLILLGKEISFKKEGKTFFAEVLDIDENCSLVVKLKKGEIIKLSSGEVSLESKNFTC